MQLTFALYLFGESKANHPNICLLETDESNNSNLNGYEL